jgi:hypothetical protein
LAVASQLPEFALDFLPGEKKIRFQPLKTEGRRHQQAIDVQFGQIGKELLNFGDIGFAINTGIGDDLKTHLFGFLNGADDLLKAPSPADDAVMGGGQAVEMDAQGQAGRRAETGQRLFQEQAVRAEGDGQVPAPVHK